MVQFRSPAQKEYPEGTRASYMLFLDRARIRKMYNAKFQSLLVIGLCFSRVKYLLFLCVCVCVCVCVGGGGGRGGGGREDKKIGLGVYIII